MRQRVNRTKGVSYNKAHTPGIPVYENPPRAFVVSAAVSLSRGPTGSVRQRKRYVVERKTFSIGRADKATSTSITIPPTSARRSGPFGSHLRTARCCCVGKFSTTTAQLSSLGCANLFATASRRARKARFVLLAVDVAPLCKCRPGYPSAAGHDWRPNDRAASEDARILTRAFTRPRGRREADGARVES